MNPFSKYSPSEKITCAVALLVGLYFLATFLWLVLGNFWPGPLFDYWVDIPLIEKSFDHQLTFNDLVTAHNNAHRILIPRLLFILDYHFFAGTNVLLITVSMLCKLATLFLFNALLKDRSLLDRVLLNALIFSAILNAGNVYNILFNFDIQWDLVSFFACCAIFFYTKVFENKKNRRYRTLAYLFFVLGFFSHAGALSLPFVFITISVFNKNLKETFFNIFLTLTVFYINNLMPFADLDGVNVQGAANMLLFHPLAVAVFVAKAIGGSPIFYLGTLGLYFSIYLLALFFISMAASWKIKSACNNVFLYISLFLFLMITAIAAARSAFTPNVWAASRFQTTILLFILCLHIHAWFVFAGYFKNRARIFFQSILFVHGLAVFFLFQYFNYDIPYKLSNAVFFSQAYMLSHERNQHNGPRLLLWLHDQDVIADSDPFFRKNNFAWYANKASGAGSSADFIDVGKTLVPVNDIPVFQSSCREKITSLKYQWTQDGGIEFSSPLNHDINNFFTAVIHRTTYYALDKNGVVVGSAYIFVDETGFLKQASLAGYSLTETVRFFAETNDQHQPTCLYSVMQDQ